MRSRLQCLSAGLAVMPVPTAVFGGTVNFVSPMPFGWVGCDATTLERYIL